jgi:hypothetical protein
MGCLYTLIIFPCGFDSGVFPFVYSIPAHHYDYKDKFIALLFTRHKNAWNTSLASIFLKI